MNREIRIKNKVGGYDYPQAMLNGIDETNMLSSGTFSNLPYTASEDCYMTCQIQGVSGATFNIKINGVETIYFNTGTENREGIIFPIKKGQTITTTGGGYKEYVVYKVYGIKH